MKKIYLTFIIILSIFQFTYAQWTVNGSNIYVTTPSNVVVGNATSETIDTSAALFPGVIPKMEILTSGSASPFSELVTIRHAGVGAATGPHQLGFLLKLSSEATTGESGKMGGLLLESNNNYSNSPSLSLLTNNIRQLTILSTGNVLIGKTSQNNSAYKLDVAGPVRANSIIVNTTGADFVFDSSYKLNTLPALKEYIDQNHHLPEIASAKEMQKDGLNLGENQIKLLQKVEELTLYLIDKDKQLNEEKLIVDKQQKDNDAQKQINQQLSDELKAEQAQNISQENRLDALEKQIEVMKQQMDKMTKQSSKQK